MLASPDPAPSRKVSALPVITNVTTDERRTGVAGVAIPRPEAHLVLRMGGATPNGIDAHAMGVRQTVHRKQLPGGLRTVMVRVRLGAAMDVLGASGAAIAGRVVALEDLWGGAAARRLFDRVAGARDTVEASAIVHEAIAERVAGAGAVDAHARLVRSAAERLTIGSVSDVASELGVSERHLRRVFHDAVGVGPKTFARIARFGRAVRSARVEARPNWARIAADAGYYDQPHLIAEFRAVAGTTPQALIGELRDAHTIV